MSIIYVTIVKHPIEGCLQCFYLFLFVCLFVFGCTQGMWKFPGHGLNPCHSSNQSHGCNNTKSLTCVTEPWGNTRRALFLFVFSHAHSTWNLCHSSNPSCCRDNTGSLIHCTTRELLFLLFFCFCFLGLHPRHMRVPRLRVKSEPQLPAYARATAIRDPSWVCDLYHSSWQRWIPDQLSEARDQTPILMDTSWICFHWATKGTPCFYFLFVCVLGGNFKDTTWIFLVCL